MDTIKKEDILQALEDSHGIVTVACKSIGLARQTYYNWLNNDEAFKLAVDEIRETAIDFVESKLMQKINGITCIGKEDTIYELPPSDTAIIFFLKTRGKTRGYIERSEIDVNAKVTQISFED